MNWKWLQRPRWLLVMTGGVALTVWSLWPVKIYSGIDPYFIAFTDSEPKHFLGRCGPFFYPDPWMADRDFDTRFSRFVEVKGIGDEARWEDAVLHFRTANVSWRVDPVWEIKGAKRGEPAWAAEVEKLGRRTAGELARGELEQMQSNRVPRIYLWIRNRIGGWTKKAREKWAP